VGLPGVEGPPGESTFSGPKGEAGEPGETKYCLPDLRLPLEMYMVHILADTASSYCGCV